MSKIFNFRSKKGMSLAVSLVICLFLILVTGGVTTVAMLQQNETGSNMNTRQAYISAKSGLDTIKDALAEKMSVEFPAVDDESRYYVFFYNEAGVLCSERCDSEDAAKQKAMEYADNDDKTLVGGKGTYFKIQKNEDGKYKVTALNVTGKYNANVSLNRGDLSFDVKMVTTYKIKLNNTTEPTEATTEKETETTTTTPPPPDSDTSPFIMVGQQSCLNAADNFIAPGGASESAFKTLNQYTHQNGQVFYIGYNLDNRDGIPLDQRKYAYSYFPIVYDKMVHWTSETERASLTAYNEGIYYLGEGSGKGLGWLVDGYTGLSSITQNTSFNPEIRCKFLCIENDFLSVAKDVNGSPKIYYAGPAVEDTATKKPVDYVVAYLANSVDFYVIDSDGKQLTSFSKGPGYFKIASGSDICKQDTWKTPITDPAEVEKWNQFNLYETIVRLEKDGEIHSGCNETVTPSGNDYRVQITGNGGKINSSSCIETGYASGDTYIYNSIRDNFHIFLSPNLEITESGSYNWYAGKSFNFQWFRQFPLSVVENAHVKMSAASIVLTIGPEIIGQDGKLVSVSKEVIAKGSSAAGNLATWKFYGKGETQAPASIKVFSQFVVKYDGKEYTVAPGVYKDVPVGLNLFSDEGKKFFTGVDDTKEDKTEDKASDTTASGGITTASITPKASKVVNLLSKLRNGFKLAPMAYIAEDLDGDGKVTLNAFIEDQIIVPENVNKLIIDDGINDKFQRLTVSSSTVIKKTINGVQYDYITFDLSDADGTQLRIPDVAGVPLDFLDIDMLKSRAELAAKGANYTVEPIYGTPVILKEYY